MPHGILTRIPVVGGVAYKEHVRALPGAFTATLSVEPDNRYFQHAIVVAANGQKIGYVAPEVAVNYYETVKTASAALTCAARRAARTDHETSGVEVLLDFTSFPPPSA